MSTFKSMHKYYSECYTDNSFDSEKILKYFNNNNYYNANKRVELLRDIYEIALDKDFMNEFGVEYIRNPHMTINDVVDKYNLSIENSEDKINENTGRSRIIYCSQKINKVFKEVEYDRVKYDIITWIFKKKTSFNETTQIEKIDKIDNIFLEQIKIFKEVYNKKKYKVSRKDLIIDLPKVDEVKEVEDDEFENFMEILRPYSKNQITIVQSVINNMTKEVGYFNYLINNTDLSEKDLDRREDILRWLGLGN